MSGYSWNDALIDAKGNPNRIAQLRDQTLNAPVYEPTHDAETARAEIRRAFYEWNEGEMSTGQFKAIVKDQAKVIKREFKKFRNRDA